MKEKDAFRVGGERGSAALSAEEFERQYAERSGLSVEQLRAVGRVVRRCDCGDSICDGWQSVSRETAAELDAEPLNPE